MPSLRSHSPAAPLAILGALLLATSTASAQQRPAQGPRWAAIRQVFGQGEEKDGYLRINLPRTDLHVRIGGDALEPEFEFTSYIGFVPHGAGNVLAMGEMVLLQQEVPAVLAEAHGSIAEYVFPRNEAVRVHGVSVKSSGAIETGSEVVFQQLGNGRVASTGELYLLASEVEPVVSALEANGLHVTALHNHMLDDGPAHFWVHWYTTGDGPTLARGIAAALEHINGARKSKSEH